MPQGQPSHGDVSPVSDCLGVLSRQRGARLDEETGVPSAMISLQPRGRNLRRAKRFFLESTIPEIVMLGGYAMAWQAAGRVGRDSARGLLDGMPMTAVTTRQARRLLGARQPRMPPSKRARTSSGDHRTTPVWVLVPADWR
jgi:hypothetical protein